MDQMVQIVGRHGLIRPRDLDAHGIPRQYLNEMEKAGKVQRSGRGIYAASGRKPTEHHAIAEVCKRAPNAVVCLASALRMHGLTTQLPHEVWIAVDRKARKPRIDYPPLRVFWFSGEAMKRFVQTTNMEGVDVHVYSPAKTVADCFKYRNKIGLDVAIEALRDCRRRKKASVDELWAAAKVCRVGNVMRPYMEVIG